MIGYAPRWLLVTIFTLVVAVGCSATTTPPAPAASPTTSSTSDIDYVALEAEIETAITTGPATLDNVRAVLVSVDGDRKIAHYRHDFTEDDHGHVLSVSYLSEVRPDSQIDDPKDLKSLDNVIAAAFRSRRHILLRAITARELPPARQQQGHVARS